MESIMKKNEEITIQDLLGLFLPKMWLIVIITVVCAAGVGIYTRLAKPLTYTASTKLCLYSQDDRTTDQANINAATQNTPLYMMAVTENIFLSDVLAALPAPYNETLTITYLQKVVKISQNEQTRAFTVSVTDTDKERAFAIADTICTISNDEFLEIFGEKASKVVPLGKPELPQHANSRGTVRNAVVGGVAGLVFALLGIWLFSVLDTTIRDKKKIEDNFDIPVIGVIPLQKTETVLQNAENKEGTKA